MPTSQPFTFSPLLERVREIAPQDIPIYLVGGAVRDALLGQPTHDLDFALSGNVLALARHEADHLGGANYHLA